MRIVRSIRFGISAVNGVNKKRVVITVHTTVIMTILNCLTYVNVKKNYPSCCLKKNNSGLFF